MVLECSAFLQRSKVLFPTHGPVFSSPVRAAHNWGLCSLWLRSVLLCSIHAQGVKGCCRVFDDMNSLVLPLWILSRPDCLSCVCAFCTDLIGVVTFLSSVGKVLEFISLPPGISWAMIHLLMSLLLFITLTPITSNLWQDDLKNVNISHRPHKPQENKDVENKNVFSSSLQTNTTLPFCGCFQNCQLYQLCLPMQWKFCMYHVKKSKVCTLPKLPRCPTDPGKIGSQSIWHTVSYNAPFHYYLALSFRFITAPHWVRKKLQ